MGKILEPYSCEKEEAVRKFWQQKKIPEKVRRECSKRKKNFYMMDGPPYASGHIHMGTALNKVLKDITIRYRRMQGFDVRDQPGYDTHGLPIEHKVEKKLGIANKAEIERFGIARFVDECRKFATEFIGVMNSEFDNLGVWMDWGNPYLTLTNEYIEAIWWTFKRAEEKGLLYLGNYPVHVCPRCETAVAYNEIEYTKLTDASIYVKFPVKGDVRGAVGGAAKKVEKNLSESSAGKKFFVVWTTTPWTLPGNTGIMASPKFDYVEAEVGNEIWVLAKERLQGLMSAVEAGYKINREFKGKELEGMRYENPVAAHCKLPKLENAYRVIMSERYVNLAEGTGLVHCAPGHGKEDFDAGTKAKLPALCPVGMNGIMASEAGKYAGKRAREVDAEIIEDLKQAGMLLYAHPYTHDYPVCWRCNTPLLMISTPQWFFRITAIRDRLMELNKRVLWVPKFAGERFENWLENLGDWPVSRQRYWGTPLPLWVCKKCNSCRVVASRAELAKSTKLPSNIDLHRPWIDAVKLPCKCGSVMERVAEVMDVWFDSGVASWGSLGYPQKTELFKKFWPADINIEAKDQIRGWWNSQLITSAICFDESPFKAVMMHGTVTDLSRKKMSKSEGNIVTPQEVVGKHGRDCLRFYLAMKSNGDDFGFDYAAFGEINRFFNLFWNACNFVSMYMRLEAVEGINAKGLQPEDLWLLSRLARLAQRCAEGYDRYEYWRVLFMLNEFVLEELSRTYIKLVRGRIGTKSGKAVEKTLNYAITCLARILAPIAPHACEHIYRQQRRKAGMPQTIQMLAFPKGESKFINGRLETQMEKAKEIAQSVLNMRESAGIRLRWQLKELVVQSKSGNELGSMKHALARMCNVKTARESKAAPKGNYSVRDAAGAKLHLCIEADEKLREEWELSELVRRVQAARKEAKLLPDQRARLRIASSDAIFLKKYTRHIEKETNTRIAQAKPSRAMEKVLEREFSIELE